MSHVATIDLEVRDLDALGRAAERCGCELVRDVSTFKWYGRSVGDTPLPEGFTVADLGTCEHVVRVKGGKPEAYEVGVVRRRDGRPGYALMLDSWAGGHGLVKAVGGAGCEGLKQAYAVETAAAAARRQGFRVTETTAADGSVVLRCSGGRGGAS